MALISNFPAERDWDVVIDALIAALMNDMVITPIKTRAGEVICDNSGTEIFALKKLKEDI